MSERILTNYIGGEFVAPMGGKYIDDIGPATGESVAKIPRSGKDDIDRAVQAARKAFRAWRDTSLNARCDLLEKIAQGIETHFDKLVKEETLDTGKPIRMSSKVDVPRAVLNFRFFAGAARHTSQDFHPMDDAINYTLRKPLGVAGLITPWNLPIYLLSWKVAPALAMGNTVVAKPSELTPLTASGLAEIFSEAGVPPGVFNLVHGLGPEAGQALVEHPDVPMISFTGGTATGKMVAATAAPMFKKLSLELGGKNPTIVFADADQNVAVDGVVRAGFLNTGQVCLCGSRILIQREIFDDFSAKLIDKVSKMKVGDPMDPDTELGPLVSFPHRQKVESYFSLGQEEGGKLETGGHRPELPEPFANGAFVRPTVFTGLPPSCRTAQEEIFGPVVTLHPFDTEAEALEMANGVSYGLCASVWTQDLARAHRVSKDLDTGMVWVNTWLHRDLRVPFGGMKDSGVGREGGKYSLQFFSESRNICIKL